MKKLLILTFASLFADFGAYAKLVPAFFDGMPDTAESIEMGSYTYFYEDKSGDNLPLVELRKTDSCNASGG